MIQRRLEERSWAEERFEEQGFWPEEREERRWPATFCLGE